MATIDQSEVPYLNEVLDFLPIDAIDKEDITTYINNITNLVLVNYKHEQYQFAYFGLHLLYMTYIYCTVWKISKINETRYTDVVVFARSYNNKKIDLCEISSIFDYCLIPERELPKIFKLIELDPSQIENIRGLVDIRNDMTHASGKIHILTEENFNVKANAVYISMKNIHSSMDKQIRLWFQNILLKYYNEEYNSYYEIEDIILEQMIQSFYLSVNDLLVCNEMSVSELIATRPELGEKLSLFKHELKGFCENSGYI